MVNILRNLQIGISIISFCFALMTLFLILNQKNPIYAVFSFILTVFSVFIIFFIFGAEFLALLVLIIYIGVITVLFLFTVIIYNLRVINIKRSPYFQG